MKMERFDNNTRRNGRNLRKKARKPPKVPIKTYRWEDIRRARRRGGYPWTYLYKGPYTGKIDPEQFTMDALRRAKSSSPMGRRSDRIEISEVSSWADYSGKTTPTLLQELIDEPNENASAKNSRPSSVVIEEYVDDKDLEDDVQIKEFQMESAESSTDNISQYLDKDERGPTPSKSSDRDRRAKSEEDNGQRKRKISAESSFSLSKIGVLKKLQDAKNKIKVPKLSFPTKKLTKNRSSSLKEDKPKKPLEPTKLRKVAKPEYIYIPLKPPPGESDEFSHLEFEAKDNNNDKTPATKTDFKDQETKAEENTKTEESKHAPEETKTNIEESQTNIEETKTNIEETKTNTEETKTNTEETKTNIEETKTNTEINKTEAVEEDKEKITPFSTLERGPRVTKKPPLKINPAFKKFLKDVRELKDKEELTLKPEDADKQPPLVLEEQQDKKPLDLEEQKDEEPPLDLEEQQSPESESPKEDFDKLFEASTSRSELEPSPSRNARSKSAEPQQKRRSSMDSSYSRKSLSKLAIMKKLKSASDKIKSAFSLDNFKKKIVKKEVEPEVKVEDEHKKPKPTVVMKSGHHLDFKPKKIEPVYIHIPLKPPEGETDEFSYLESESRGDGATKSTEPENKEEPTDRLEERTDSLDSTSSPLSPPGVQFIFLTPPSDDEILDKDTEEVPETPSSNSEDMVFNFTSLKKLAEDAVDRVSPESRRRGLDTVSEESDKGSTNEDIIRDPSINGEDKTQIEAIEDVEDAKKVTEVVEDAKILEDIKNESEIGEADKKIIIDVEDGLNEALRQEERLKSALKTAESGTGPKRVSFKRKSKTPKDKDKDSGYETIEVPKEEQIVINEPKTEEKPLPEEKSLDLPEKVLITDLGQSMSVDEEKSYLDQKIVKDVSLEEDYNKWTIGDGDHEYEPINPPNDEMTILTMPNVTVVDRNSDPKLVISATEILDEPTRGEKKRSFFQFGRGDREKSQDRGGDREKSQDRGDSMGSKSSTSQGRDEVPETDEPQKSSEGPNKFQVAFKQSTDKVKAKTNELRNKIHNMKRPSLPKAPEFKKPHFKKPDFKRFKIEKPKLNLHLPKLPDTATIHLPNISLPGTRRTTSTRTIETRQFSTESNVDDSEQQKKRHKFDLTFGGTFPRFKKAKKPQEVVFATVPRIKNGKKSTTISSEDSTRIPLHSEDSMDASEHLDLEEATEAPRRGYEDHAPSVDNARLPKQRFSGDVALDEEYERENQAINRADYLSRWQHGNFKERNEDSKDEKIVGQLVEQRFGKTGYKSYSDQEQEDPPESLEARLRKDEERPQYIEDTEEEEFDLRLTQQNRHMITDLDNLEDENGAGQDRGGYSSEGSGSAPRKGRLGKLDVDSDEFFVVHEIREGFQNPANALAQMNEYDPIGSNRSLPVQMQERPEPIKAERKSIKKPKRKKTPHVSREEIPVDEESVEEILAPSRPKRKSKRNKKKQDEKIVPYQETIPHEIDVPHGERLEFPRESLGILGDDERDEFETYEKEQPDIMITEPHKEFQVAGQGFRKSEDTQNQPSAPPRQHRSLRSLTSSVNDSILMDPEDQIASPYQMPPKRPSRRSRSQTSSLSRASLPPSQRDTDSIFTDEGYMAENQQIPSYLIENQSYKEQYQGILDRQPCAEEPCKQDIRDCMGYAIVDKSKQRDPPLPPPRTPPRRRKRETEPEKFATVPRHMGLNQSQAPPVRPLRNYSTLSHIRSSRNGSLYANEEDDKENNQIDISQYIEIDDDINRDLVSGDIVQKMRQRPLPAPPRPPRKTKSTRKSLQDITSKENIIPSTSEHKQPEEENVSTQTEPLPSDFVCEEIRQEPTDTIITPRVQSESPIERFEIYDPRRTVKPEIRRELITPTVYSFEETVTHGTLLVQPIDGAKVVPDHQLSREHLVPVTKEFSDEDETSEIPESFKQLRNPKEQVLKAEKLQVSNMDVDSLTVNQLLASKLVVSEIDASTITTNEIQGKSGTLKVGDIELPPQLLEQLVRQINNQETSQEDVKKKTPIAETVPIEEPTVDLEPSPLEDRLRDEVIEHEISPEPPIPPPRGCTLDESSPDAPPRTLRRKSKQDSPRLEDPEPSSAPNPLRTEMLEPDIDDQPPPRPPQPLEGLYLPSQPPASFYALRAKQYVDENIPTAPRRKRHPSGRSRPVSRSRSTSDDSSTVHHRPQSRLQPRRASEPSISELSGRLVQACGSRINNTLKRLIYYLTENLLHNVDGNQDMHVFIIILLILIAGLILLGYGEGRTVVHLHHWEYFNPPKDL